MDGDAETEFASCNCVCYVIYYGVFVWVNTATEDCGPVNSPFGHAQPWLHLATHVTKHIDRQ